MNKLKKFFGIKTYKEIELPILDRMSRLIKQRSWFIKNFRFDEYRLGFSCFTEKPVYNLGETVRVFVLIFEKWSRCPLPAKILAKRFNLEKMSISVKNSKGKAILKAKMKTVDDWSGVFFEFPLSKESNGGDYSIHIKYANNDVESTRFYVINVSVLRNILEMNLNKEFLVGDGEVTGKLSLKVLSKTADQIGDLPVQVKIYKKEMELIQEISETLSDCECVFSFDCEVEWEKIVVIAELKFEGETLNAMRQIEIKKAQEMQIKFVPSGGKVLLNSENLIYFNSFLKGEEGVPLPFKNAEIYEIDCKEQDKFKIKTISSNENGRGKFSLLMKKDYYYEMKISGGSNNEIFYILGPKDLEDNYEEKITPLKMEIDSRVFNWNQEIVLKFKKREEVFLDNFRVVFMVKMKVYFEKELTFPKKQTTLEFTFKLSKTKIKNAGVYEFQVYKSSNTKKMCQDMLVFVKPETKLGLNVSFDKARYAPGDEVQMSVSFPNKKEQMIGIVVSDETAFLEVDENRLPVSPFTKVFLENELKFLGNGNFQKSQYYIDWMFENNKDYLRKILKKEEEGSNMKESEEQRLSELDLLLGLQDWRLFLFEEMKLSKLIYKKEGSTEQDLSQIKKLLPINPHQLAHLLPRNDKSLHENSGFFGYSPEFRGQVDTLDSKKGRHFVFLI